MSKAPDSYDHIVLYAGDDLRTAASRSRVDPVRATTGSRTAFARFWRDIRNTDWHSFVPTRQWVSGLEERTQQESTILFAGSLRMVSYCSDTLFGKGSWKRVSAASVVRETPDLVVLDHPLLRDPRDSALTIRTPPWVRLEFRIANDWNATLELVPSKQLKRVARHLRRFGYTARCSSGAETILSFRKEMLLPNAERRFGESAIIASEASFLDECREMIRLDLLSGETVVASNLLSFDEDRMTISKGAPAPGFDELKGRMDVLDYFSLLIAQLMEKSVLDFGLCRANLDDGPLRYKTKWGARIVPAGGLKVSTRIVLRRVNTKTASILRRNRFIELEDSGFMLRFLADTEDCVEKLPDLVARAAAAGIGRVDLLGADKVTAEDLTRRCGITVHAVPFHLA